MTDEGGAKAAEPGSPKRNGTPWKAAMVLAAMFLFGAASGVAVGRITALRDFRRMVDGPPAEARVSFRVEAMRRHLDLSPAQVTRVRAVIAETEVERDKVMGACGPAMESLRKRADARLREILDEEQRKRFDDMVAHRGRPPGPWLGMPPPPPPPEGPGP